MKKIALALMFTVALGASAQNVPLWNKALPGTRKAMDLSGLPDGVFTAHTEVVEKKAAPVDVDNGYAAKISSLKITGLVWSLTPAERRVLMGDIVMREGQSIPPYVFDDGKTYTLKKIEKDRLDFETLDDTSNTVAFQVMFGLKESLKNESSYSSPGKR
jgi:hypothetical protein